MDLDGPPAYSVADPLQPAASPQTRQGPAISDATTSAASNTYEIFQSHSGVDVNNGDRQVYHIGRHDAISKPNLIAYGGYDHHGPHLAQVEFIQFDKNFRMYLGSLKHPEKDDWDMVRCASDGHLMHTDCYRFEVAAPSTGSTGTRRKRRLH